MKKFMVETRIDKLDVMTQFFEIFDDFQLIDAIDEKEAQQKYVSHWQDKCNEFLAFSPQVQAIQAFNDQTDTT